MDLSEPIADLDHYLQPSVLLSADARAQRRAILAAMGAVYRLRNLRESEMGTPAYRARAAASADGAATGALIMIRGGLDHDISRAIAPVQHVLYPSSTTFPGRWTFPGENPTWRKWAEIEDLIPSRFRPPPLEQGYRNHLEGQIIGYTFDAARRFLVENW